MARTRRMSIKWRSALRQMMPRGSFDVDTLHVTTGEKRSVIRACLYSWRVRGWVALSGGRYALTPDGIEKILED